MRNSQEVQRQNIIKIVKKDSTCKLETFTLKQPHANRLNKNEK
jgi:hypothetical protein